MKRLWVTIAAATLLAVLVSAGPAGRGRFENGSDSAPVHRASGGGTVEYAGALNTHAFTAQVDADGNVKGQAEFQLRYIDTTVRGSGLPGGRSRAESRPAFYRVVLITTALRTSNAVGGTETAFEDLNAQ